MARTNQSVRGKLVSLLSLLIICSLILTQVPPGIVIAQTTDSGDWSSYRHDPAGTSFATDETLLAPPLEQTEFVTLFSPLKTGASPILYDGFLFILEENGLCAYRLEDQTQSWCYSGLDDLLVSGVTGEEIVAVGVEPSDGSVTVVRLSLIDGTVQGQLNTGVSPGNGFACSAAADDQLFCNIDASILKMDLTGNVTAWSTLLDGNGNTPVVLGDSVFTATGTTVYALSTVDGSITWNMSQPAGPTESLLVYGTTLIVTGVDGNIYNLDTLTGVQEWTHTFPDDTPCLAAYGNGDLIVTTSAGLIEKLDTDSGAALWTYDPVSAEPRACPVPLLANGYVYAAYPDGTVRALEVSTGSLAWEGAVASPGFLPGLAVYDGQLVVTVSPLQVSLFAEVTTPPEPPSVGEQLAEPLFSISGTIVDGEGVPLTGVQVEDGQGHAALTDENGYYMFSGLPAGDYLLAPVSVDYDFSPANYPLTLLEVDLVDINFTGQITFEEDPDLTDPGEGLITTEALTPVITGFTPGSAIINDPTFTTLAVSGENFVNTSEVKWGETSLVTNYISDTALTAAIPPDLVAVTGQFPITVVNPELEGGTSGEVPFSVENPLPLIYALTPNHSISLPPPVDPLNDPGITMEVTGANFVDGAQVIWDDAGLDTQFISPTQLTAVVPTVLLGAPKQVSITVNNPVPGGGTSVIANFMVEDFLPADGQKLASSKVYFNWADTPGANAYQIQMSLYSDFRRLIINGPVYDSHYYYGKVLQNGKTYYWRVQSRIGSTWGGWSATRTFYSMNPPLAPVMVTPNRDLTNETEPMLSWNETINAERYQVQVSTNDTFTSLLQDVIVPDKGTSFTAATLEEGLYYWRVRGIDSVGVNGAWSRYRSFRIDTTPPASPPALDLPQDGVFTDTTTPSLSVKAVSDAFEYCFQLDDSVTFDDTLVNPACDSRTTSTSWTVPVEAMLGYQTYYWRAMAIDAAGNISGASTTRRLNLSIVQTPADSSFSSITIPEFSWIAHPEAVNYHLQVSTAPDFEPETENFIDEQLSSTVFSPVTELDYDTYYLRLEVDTGTGFTGSWMPVQKFTISPVPEIPVPLIPVNGVLINDKTPLLSWSEVVDLIVPVSAYEIQVSTDAAFSILTNTGIAADSATYEAGELLDGQYYWRVRSVNDLGVPGAWSSTANFWLDATPVNPPPYYSPASGATVTTTTPKLTVRKVSGAVYYRFQVAVESTFTTPLLLDKQVTPGLTTASYNLNVADALPFGTVYWRAATMDGAGNEAWGEVRPLLVNILKAPENGSTTMDSTPTFSWMAVAGVVQYQIQVASTPAYDTAAIMLDEILTPSTSFTPLTALDPGNYYWRIRVNTGAGFPDNWTPIFSFIVSPVNPAAPYVMEPVSGMFTNNPTPRLRWVETFQVYAPQLRIKNRTVQVYLPPDYATSGKSYPVIYLNDGTTKFIDGYYVDDTLEKLFYEGQIKGVIAVAIFDSGNRWDEFSPWVNTHMDDIWYANNAASSEGGEGDAYVDFLVDTLKPIIDNRYHTLSDREHTAIGAGSLGGFISLYAALREPDIFSKVMVLSPAVWFGEAGGAWLSNNRLINYIKNHPVPQDTKFFIYTGTNEWAGRLLGLPGMTYPQVWVSGANALRSAIVSTNPESEVNYVVNSGGIHSATSWRWWIDDAVVWLFGDIEELPETLPAAGEPAIGHYEIQISPNSFFTTIEHTGYTLDDQLSYEGETLEEGRHYWRVRSINSLGEAGKWSSTANFWLDTTPLNPPPYISPASGATSTTTTPKLIVSRVSGAASYRFQVAAEPTFTAPVLLDKKVTPGLTTASYNLNTAEALSFGTYYWRAATIDRSGNIAWGESRVLVVNILKTPVNGGSKTDQTPTFSWGEAAGAIQYQFQLATAPQFDAAAVILDQILTPVTSFTPTSALNPGNYYWRMRVNSGAGFTENWTSAFSFLVSPVTQAAPFTTDPVSGYYTNDSSPRFRWVESFSVYEPGLRVHDRTIQVYLPPDYATSGKSYPVIYLSDGALQFNDRFYTDNTLEELYHSGQIKGVIAVAVFTNANRWDEFCPWINPNLDSIWHAWHADSSEGGEGDAYVDFFVDTLKPIIDSRYRTLSSREYTAVGGASMGGLISIYTGLRGADVYSKVISLSPAVWYGEMGGPWLSNNKLLQYIKAHPEPEETKFYFYAGTNEWEGRRLDFPGMTYPQIWKSGVDAVYAEIKKANPDSEVKYEVNPGGIHMTSSWRWYMDDAFLWLFGDIQELPDTPAGEYPVNKGLAENHYEIQISKSNLFTTIEYQGYTMDGQLSFDGVELPSGKHYWRVRAVNELGTPGTWSSVRYVVVDIIPPSAPEPISPKVNAYTSDITPTLTVKAVNDASLYCFQVADSLTFDNILVNPDCSLTSTNTYWSVPSANKLPYGDGYYWRALAIDRAGNLSAWTDSRKLTISIMKNPVDHSNTTSTKPKFTWVTISGGQMYQLQVVNDPVDIGDPLSIKVLDVERLPSSSYIPATPLATGQYYWSMRVKISGTYGDWMPVQTFTVSPIPAAPILTAPGSGTLTNDKTPLLSWDAVVDPIIITGYQVQLSRSSLFTNSTLEEVTGVTTYESTAITDDGRYYWRVRAVNDLGVIGTWSAIRSVVIDTTRPNTPSLVIPLDGATVNGLPFYYWYSDITATYHQFEFATDPGFINVEYRTGELTVPYHILPGQKPGTYYWHARARDVAGNWSDWSESRQVIIAP